MGVGSGGGVWVKVGCGCKGGCKWVCKGSGLGG